jgi:hypothetical protein
VAVKRTLEMNLGEIQYLPVPVQYKYIEVRELHLGTLCYFHSAKSYLSHSKHVNKYPSRTSVTQKLPTSMPHCLERLAVIQCTWSNFFSDGLSLSKSTETCCLLCVVGRRCQLGRAMKVLIDYQLRNAGLDDCLSKVLWN